MPPETETSRLSEQGSRRARARRRTIGFLATDSTAWIGGFVAAVCFRYEFGLTAGQLARAAACGFLAAVVHVAVAAVRRIYSGRHPLGSLQEVQGVAGTAATTAMILLIGLLPADERPVPASTPLVGGALALLFMLTARFTYRHRRDLAMRPDVRSSNPVLLFGLGDAGQGLLRAMLSDPRGRYRPVGALDDDPDKRDLRIGGVRVLGGRRDVAEAVRRTGATTVIFSVANADAALIRHIREATLQTGAAFKVLPPVGDLVDHRITVTDIRDVQIGDLLGRRQVVADMQVRTNGLTGRRILVTGAGGSIGSELCRQLMKADPGELMMLDRDESALHGLQMSLTGRAMLDGPELILADLRDDEEIRRIIRRRRPEIIFHAAALKHLTLLERHPGEAVKTNVWGTLSVLDACQDVARFVNISTDKAADPISVLGYSKRITERLTAHAASRFPGTFLSVRFGNVLSSRGSVVTAFQRQIELGRPLTVTHPEVTRYLMTLQEAVHLVLQAAEIGRDGEALVLDMGEPVRIADLARQLAEQAESSVPIVYTGLRPGEKLHENLFGTGEVDTRPLHPLVSHVTVPALDPMEVSGLNPYDDAEKVAAQLALLCGHPAGPVHTSSVQVPLSR
ncbi:NDP-sugar epimerase, includes UDP-GlcNAc-inverting 4,6-dehydratase FlaA1 and capsular polysaccharide biosynthesis protein EpsC [Micromonospora citrea]|uniref:NDP-sugar epimerase, includes UDP-GlcNAc-inverting 4,6-dehydratase FlaA1 and capsular polysaccharide biosynthesis protein EpsC n=1 Tax=Micromonospora citrea TaxID=47855 RepID=A0A1C6U381_9ACTN|nr:polysaccharide biosynthesis protein [Micromonospora citrea]SCL48339.1 NDP-sugar epimerase, includes UDP-GlcNAc-inverting 4,6-dehydratase FlaA1 and capsular polysaccharide biosynthesis protein EpsC [Micromonospora citrea]